MKKLDFSGVFSVMLTPFEAPGRVNTAAVRQLVDFYIDKGVDGLFPCGSAGEAVHLSFDERVRLAQTVVAGASGRVPVIPGVIASNVKDALHLAHAYREAGCDGIVLPPPIYYRFEPAYIEQYFQTVLDQAGLPVVLYNIPAYAQPIDAPTLGKLSAHPAAAGVKDSSGSMVDLLHFLDAISGNDVGFMVGREEMLFACLAVGGSGSMSAINAVVPEIMVAIRDLFHAGEFSRSNQLQNALIPLIRALYAPQVPVGFRHGLSLRGFDMGEPAHPVPASRQDHTAPLLATIKTELDKALAMPV